MYNNIKMNLAKSDMFISLDFASIIFKLNIFCKYIEKEKQN